MTLPHSQAPCYDDEPPEFPPMKPQLEEMKGKRCPQRRDRAKKQQGREEVTCHL